MRLHQPQNPDSGLAATAQPCLILLHGLSRSYHAMAKMADHFEALGYRVRNIDYPSTSYPIETLLERVAPLIQEFNSNQLSSLNFVGHSLGSILIHFYIKKYRPRNLGRVVALGPPYHGSEIIDHLGKYRWYQKLHGPAALELSTFPSGIFPRLGEVDYELGVIAGNRYIFFDWFFAKFWLKHPSDGKVTVASTEIPGYQDRIILPVNHVFFPSYPEVIQQSAFFLVHGVFKK